jgi:hypothetical protein
MSRKRKEDEEKYCKYCGKRLSRKRLKNGKLESNIHFHRRTYCDRLCMRKSFLKKDGVSTWVNSHTTARRTYALFIGENRCSVCGKDSGRLDVHHIDFNEQNNNPENLKLLCRSCHMKTHRVIKTCSVENCDRPVKGHGYCDKHYQRWKKYGDPLIVNKGYGHFERVI